jgi:hypothetical protein
MCIKRNHLFLLYFSFFILAEHGAPQSAAIGPYIYEIKPLIESILCIDLSCAFFEDLDMPFQYIPKNPFVNNDSYPKRSQ